MSKKQKTSATGKTKARKGTLKGSPNKSLDRDGKTVTRKAIREAAEAQDPKALRPYKDTMFRMLFNNKENLLSLYNAVNGTAYTDADKLEITTLENAVYTNYKNDVSFVFDFEMMLYEHQSTVNPNMPLRNLFYVTTILEGMTDRQDLYSSKPVGIPAPRFVVFYNGTDAQPVKKVLRLSDTYLKKQETPELELQVMVYNINWGCNEELMEGCRTLKEYAQYVEKVREYAIEMPFEKAVEKAIDYCIENGILADFLSKNRAEAIAVSIFEYDEEKHIRNEREIAFGEGKQEGLDEGRKEGHGEGIEEGIQAVIETSMELGSNRQDTAKWLVEKMELTPQKAEESIKKYWK